MRSLLFLFFATAASAAPTFNSDIAPLIHENCTSCHRPGESGPFPLISYEEVSKKARTVKRVINDRYMPPWHAAKGENIAPLAHSRELTDEQIELFNAWVEADKPEGDPDQKPTPPNFPAGWQLGEPDLIVTMERGFEVASDGPDIYRNFVLPLNLTEDQWVKAVEMRPSARSVVHHALYFLDDTGTARKMDGKDGKPGFKGMGFRKTGSLGGYTPGAATPPLPGDLAFPLPAGSDLVLAAHFHPSGKAETEKTTVGLYFADKAPEKKLTAIQVPPAFGRGMGIDIPAGESDYRVKDTFTVPVDAEAISIGGHAHYVCEEMKMTARFPDGTEQILLQIDDWDLDWQDTYFFAEPISLPAQTVITTELSYDNSAENPDNPFDPPQRIKWGKESTDEMGSVTLMVVPAGTVGQMKLTTANLKHNVSVIGAVAKGLGGKPLLERLPEIINRMDANGDGSLQKSEIPPKVQARVARLDFDKNDVLDPEEIQALKNYLAAMKGQS